MNPVLYGSLRIVLGPPGDNLRIASVPAPVITNTWSPRLLITLPISEKLQVKSIEGITAMIMEAGTSSS